MARAPSNVNRIQAELAKFPGLDPRAVLAIAAHEGLGGGIGDNGTSFGPFQLHYGGAYPTSAPRGAPASQAWAWSPAGIDYALSRINNVAGGLTGRAAIEAISRRFERPANPDAEIADALAHYGGGLPAGGTVAPGAPPAGARVPMKTAATRTPPAPQPRMVPNTLLANLIASTNDTLGLGGSLTLAQLLSGALPKVRA